jgi:hypothetical protein
MLSPGQAFPPEKAIVAEESQVITHARGVHASVGKNPSAKYWDSFFKLLPYRA